MRVKGATKRFYSFFGKSFENKIFFHLLDWIQVFKLVFKSIGYGYIFEKLYPHPLDTDSTFWICIQSKIRRIRFSKLVSNLKLFGYDFWNLYPTSNSLNTILKFFCIQIQNYPRYYKKLKSKSRSIQLQNKMKHNPVDVSYPKSRIQRCRP